MSQENVEIARSVLWVGADVLPLARDDATWERHRAAIEPSVEPECKFAWVGDGQRVEVTGLEQSRQFWRDFFKSWETVGCELERIVPLGNKVLALTRLHARMAESQHELEMIAASVVVVEGGRISSIEHYANRAEALEAVRLRE